MTLSGGADAASGDCPSDGYLSRRCCFADEPTGSLDSLNSQRVMELFIATAKQYGTTVIMVTHEPTIAAYADREIIVRDGQISGGM